MAALKTRTIEAAPDAAALAGLLSEAGERLPPRLRERILSLGADTVPPLIALIEETGPVVAEDDEPWGQIHAVELLGELRAAEAIEPMLRLLARTEWDSYLQDRLLWVLPKLGTPVLEPALRAYQATSNPEAKGHYCSVLAELDVRDDRIYDALLEELGRDLGQGAAVLGRYGDERALPRLLEELDAFDPAGKDSSDLFNVGEVAEAIERLGGTLTPEQERKVETILTSPSLRQRRVTSMLDTALGRMDLSGSPVRGARTLAPAGRPAPPPTKVGRNDPCPGGSGKKFKKCCLGKE